MLFFLVFLVIFKTIQQFLWLILPGRELKCKNQRGTMAERILKCDYTSDSCTVQSPNRRRGIGTADCCLMSSPSNCTSKVGRYWSALGRGTFSKSA